MKNLTTVILAAGRGTRMKSSIPKVMHDILGKPMIAYVMDLAKSLDPAETVVVAGYKSELLKKFLGKDARVVIQKELLGSGDALNAARPALKGFSGDLLVLCGDTPLLEKAAVLDLVKKHRLSRASATIMTSKLENPTGYGRILRDTSGRIMKIIEETEASLYEKVITEINVGAYCFRAKDILEALEKISPGNKKKEYFLTDAIEELGKSGKAVESSLVEDAGTIIGINSRHDLAEAARTLKTKKLESLMESGVTIVDPASTFIEPDAEIAPDTTVFPNTVIANGVRIGSSCRIGPFARLRSGVELKDNVEVGNFVELVRTKVGRNTKIKHHTYLGDAVVGNDVNIGAGTITANYDGKNKNATVIEDGVFLGVGSILIAPLRIGKGAVVGAGCVVPKNRHVPKGATVVGVPARILKR